MSVRDLYSDSLPKSDLKEIEYRIRMVKNRLEEADDDWSRQELYDCIGYQTSVLEELANDIGDICRVLTEVFG